MLNNSKSRFAKGVEIATNFSIMIVAVVGTTVLVRNYLLRVPAPAAREIKQGALEGLPAGGRNAPTSSVPSGPPLGEQLSVPGITWGDSKETVVLALSNKCHFCSESAPFYQRLASDLAHRKDVRLVAVFPQNVDEAKKYLGQLGVPIEQVVQASLDSLRVRGTPTLVIVDRTGTVKQSWVGKLTLERETEVLSRIGV
jgi:thiol-disulfide isomerase/thioredoxin